MKKSLACAVLAAVALGGSSITPAVAHHSLSAQFDLSRPFDIKGKLVRVEWVNPHPYMHFTVEEGGKTVEWGIETVGLGALRTKGMGREAVKVGETYQLRGFRARNGKPIGFLREIQFADGRKFQLWTGNPNG
jgi:hypothetical protein